MVTRAEIRRILTEVRGAAASPDDIDDDEELVLDSLTLSWLLHVLEERHGVRFDPSEAEVAELTSVRRIEACVGQHLGVRDA
jgi:acyl carrier protein